MIRWLKIQALRIERWMVRSKIGEVHEVLCAMPDLEGRLHARIRIVALQEQEAAINAEIEGLRA